MVESIILLEKYLYGNMKLFNVMDYNIIKHINLS